MAGSTGALALYFLILLVGLWLNLPIPKRTGMAVMLLVVCLFMTMTGSTELMIEPGSSHFSPPSFPGLM
jgi:uncharacterized membrane protein YhaH (DUF805 family)